MIIGQIMKKMKETPKKMKQRHETIKTWQKKKKRIAKGATVGETAYKRLVWAPVSSQEASEGVMPPPTARMEGRIKITSGIVVAKLPQTARMEGSIKL